MVTMPTPMLITAYIHVYQAIIIRRPEDLHPMILALMPKAAHDANSVVETSHKSGADGQQWSNNNINK